MKLIGLILGMALLIVALFAASFWLFMVLWNFALPAAIGAGTINFWQSAAIWALLVYVGSVIRGPRKIKR